jgi:hypothetical protein
MPFRKNYNKLYKAYSIFKIQTNCKNFQNHLLYFYGQLNYSTND